MALPGTAKVLNPPSPSAAEAAYEHLALQMIERRRLRASFFDAQFFGEHGWDLLLQLFACHPRQISIDSAAAALELTPSTVMVMARLLVSHGLVEQGDSLGRWGEIPLRLTEQGHNRVREYLARLHSGGLIG